MPRNVRRIGASARDVTEAAVHVTTLIVGIHVKAQLGLAADSRKLGPA